MVFAATAATAAFFQLQLNEVKDGPTPSIPTPHLPALSPWLDLPLRRQILLSLRGSSRASPGAPLSTGSRSLGRVEDAACGSLTSCFSSADVRPCGPLEQPWPCPSHCDFVLAAMAIRSHLIRSDIEPVILRGLRFPVQKHLGKSLHCCALAGISWRFGRESSVMIDRRLPVRASRSSSTTTAATTTALAAGGGASG